MDEQQFRDVLRFLPKMTLEEQMKAGMLIEDAVKENPEFKEIVSKTLENTPRWEFMVISVLKGCLEKKDF